jgi:hypothetical protein
MSNIENSNYELQATDETTYLEIPTTIKKALQNPVVKVAITGAKIVVGAYAAIYLIKLTAEVVKAVRHLEKSCKE